MKFRILLFLIGSLSFFSSYGQTPPHHYVVIGVFAKQDNAIRYTDRANKLNFSAQYAINPDRKLYYVYLLDTEDKRQAFAFLMKIRVETEFKQAWVFIGRLGEQQAVVEEIKKEPELIKDPVVETPKEEIKKDSVITPPVVKVDSSAIKTEVKPKPEGKPFYFKLTNGEDGAEVNGEIHIMTSSKANQYQAFPANQIVYIKAPAGAALQISTLAAGYKEMKRAVSYADPSESAAEVGANAEAIVAFPLIRVKTGDYIEFSNVRFFQNSAILQPDSKNELDGLAELMKENTKYKIKIHGHCNGEKSRDIVSKGGSTNFFATDAANVKASATAKELTVLMAEIVKEYLVSQGIDTDRISTKGEGGKQAIYPSNSTLAARNERVEIEITKGKSKKK
ncbi:MAG TPA: OmpA family protein [Cyclobacteriaceae bacterium]